ncbi:MAG: ATP-binding protein [Chitinophagales bacterium]|nr:ATP-binding protein [Chitinophagales bacterium]
MKNPCTYILLLLFLLCTSTNTLKAQRQSVVDSVKNVINQVEGEDKILPLEYLFGIIFRSKPDEAEQVANELQLLYKQYEPKVAEVKHLKLHMALANARRKIDSMYIIGLSGIQEAERIGIDSFAGIFYNDIGLYHWRKGILDSAIIYMNRAMEKNPRTSRFVNNNLGGIYDERGDLVNAIKHYELAYEEAIQLRDTIRQASFANNIGIVFRKLGRQDKANEYFLRALTLRKIINNRPRQLSPMYNLALATNLSIEERQEWVEQGLSLARSLNDPFGIQMFLSAQCVLLNDQQKYQEALDVALPLNRDSSIVGVLIKAHVLEALGDSYIGMKEWTEAEKYIKELGALGKQRNNTAWLQDARKLLLDVYHGNNQPNNYYEIAFPYYKLKDSLDLELARQKLAYLDAELIDAEKEKEIASLNNELQRKETRRRWLMAIAALVAIILSLIIYLRSRQVKTQKLLVEQEQKNAKALATANEQLRSLDQLKSRFFTNISHELRTPVTLIAAPLENGLKKHKGQIEESLETAIQTAYNNANKLGGFVEELLELSRLEAEKIKLEQSPTDIHQYLQQLFFAFESGAAIKNINYQFDNQLSEKTIVQIDKKRISKIVNNLLSNALKFTPNGGIIVLKAALQGNNQLLVSVEDSGRGISQEDLPHVFDRYFQSKNKSLTTEGGAGIGLALAKELASLMGGQLTVESEWGKGSIFNLTIPIEMVEAFNQDASLLIEETSIITSPLIAPKKEGKAAHKILIVEDNHEMQQLLVSLLSDNYDYIIANNGAEAWAMLESNAPELEGLNLILSDVMMPEMDGYTLLEKIKQHKDWCRLPMIMLTARAAEEDKLNALRLGVDDYLTKPFSTEELFSRIENLISKYEEREAFNKLEVQLEFESTPSADIQWLKELESLCLAAIDKRLELTNNYLSIQLAISVRQLQRRIKALTGMTVKQYVQEIRLQKARHLLENRVYNTVAEIAYESGFNTPAYFSRLYEKHFGKSPASYLE